MLDKIKVFFIAFIVMFIVMIISCSGYLVGYSECYMDIQEKLIKIKCGEYNKTTGKFEIINLLNKNAGDKNETNGF
jgi:hypothetical protein